MADKADSGARTTLSTLLYNAATERGITAGAVADELGMSRAYLHRLRTQPEAEKKVGRDYLERVAQFLDISMVSVLLAAGQLKPEDLSPPGPGSVGELDRAMAFIKSDPLWSLVLGPTDEMSAGLKLATVRIYERSCGLTLIPVGKVSRNLAQLLYGPFNEVATA